MTVCFSEGEKFDDENKYRNSFDVFECIIHVICIANVVEDSKDEVEYIEDDVEEAVDKGTLCHFLNFEYNLNKIG